MGLDLVEFVMEIEAEFELTIPDAEASKLLTLGDLHAWVLARSERSANDPSGTWLRIVELAEAQFDVPGARMTPQTRMLELAPYG